MTSPTKTPPAEATEVPADATPDQVPEQNDPRTFFVVPADVLNGIVGYLMEQPWRFSNQYLQALNGVRSLDEYLP